MRLFDHPELTDLALHAAVLRARLAPEENHLPCTSTISFRAAVARAAQG